MKSVNFKLNGKVVSEEEFLARGRARKKLLKASGKSLDCVLKTKHGSQERRDMANAMPMMSHWEHHESISAGVPIHQAKEHADWIKSQGIVGVDVEPKPHEHCAVIKFKSSKNREKYLKARNLGDFSSGGSGGSGAGGGSTTPKKKYRSWMNKSKGASRGKRSK